MHSRISRNLANSHIIISPENEWFKQCVDFFVSDNPNCDEKELTSMVIEQLSLSDFQEISLSSLPANLNNFEKKVLNGKYCLQVNTIIDVGQSCYSQYNVVLKRDTSNAEISDNKPAPWEPKLRRMLKMMCSDGQQNVMAMEYEPLPCLKEPFIPGFKISVVGPVEFRKGVLLLKSNNVHFIGGEVEHLLIKNAPLNVLCRALNKPEFKNPYEFSNIEVDNTAMDVQELRNNNPTRQIDNINKTDIRSENSEMSQSNVNQSNSSSNCMENYDDFFDDNDDVLLTQVAEIETQINQSDNIVNSASLQTSNVDQHNIKVNNPTFSVPKTNSLETNKKLHSTAKQTKISDILKPSSSKAFSSSVVESTKHQVDVSVKNIRMDIKQPSGKREASSPVNIKTKRISDGLEIPEEIWDDFSMDIDISNLNEIQSCKVLKSASVLKYTKIQVKEDWVLSGIVVDGTEHIEVDFSSKILENLIGVSSKDALECKNNHMSRIKLGPKIELGIKGAYRKLHLFKGEMTLMNPSEGNKKPVVTDIKF